LTLESLTLEPVFIPSLFNSSSFVLIRFLKPSGAPSIPSALLYTFSASSFFLISHKSPQAEDSIEVPRLSGDKRIERPDCIVRIAFLLFDKCEGVCITRFCGPQISSFLQNATASSSLSFERRTQRLNAAWAIWGSVFMAC